MITGLLGSDLEGNGKEGDRLTGDPLGDCWYPPGGGGACLVGCIELCFAEDGCTALTRNNVPSGPLVSNWIYLVRRNGLRGGDCAFQVRRSNAFCYPDRDNTGGSLAVCCVKLEQVGSLQ